MLPKPLLLLAQLVQLVRAQGGFSNALMFGQRGSQGISVDIFRVSIGKADIVVMDGPEMAPL